MPCSRFDVSSFPHCDVVGNSRHYDDTALTRFRGPRKFARHAAVYPSPGEVESFKRHRPEGPGMPRSAMILPSRIKQLPAWMEVRMVPDYMHLYMISKRLVSGQHRASSIFT